MTSEKSIAPASAIRRNQQILSSDLENEFVMMDVESGEYYNLQSTAAQIWRLIEKPLTVDELRNALMQEYDVEPEVCSAEVDRFLRDMLSRKLIEVIES